MKVFNKLMLGAAALALLPGCSLFQSKVSYDKFHDKAQEAHEKGHSYKKAVVNGTMESGDTTIDIKKAEFTLKSGVWTPADDVSLMAALVGAMLLAEEAYLVPEDEQTTYYVGGGFKTVTKDDDSTGTMVWNAAGLVTSAKGSGESKVNITVKYSK